MNPVMASLLVATMLLVPAAVDPVQAVTESGAPPSALSADDPSMPVYIPPQKLLPRARIGGQLRGTDGPTPELSALVPDHVGLTLKKNPTLNWFISKPTVHRVIFTLTSADSIKPVYEAPLPGPTGEGIHAIDLSELGITLEADLQYRWFVSVEIDPNSHAPDIVAGGIIERCEFVTCVPELKPNLTCNQQSVIDNMRHGFWYDAMACLCDLIKANPTDLKLRRQRAALLKQVGLHGVAEWDLRSVAPPVR